MFDGKCINWFKVCNCNGEIGCKYYYSQVPTRRTFPAMRFCGCALERGSAQDPPLRTLTGTLTGAQKVLQQRRYFSEPLVARRRSVDKPLGLPCGAFVTTGS